VQRYERDKWLEHCQFWKHIGIYAYRKSALERFVNLQRSKYEDLEKLEQLRLLEAGASFLCVVTNTKLVGVDTQADLEKVIRIIQDKNSK
jgi:3-deoxy-manno-octulosonate cytidylyltransferase (CMP-KDO synthetase)